MKTIVRLTWLVLLVSATLLLIYTAITQYGYNTNLAISGILIIVAPILYVAFNKKE